MSASDRKRKREVVALADILTNSRTPATLDGDGHKIMTLQSYLDATPWFYHEEIRRLEQVCHGAESYIDGTSDPCGVPSLSMHMWLATKIQNVDSLFTYSKKIGRGAQAREMLKAFKAFAEEHKHMLVKTPWERVRDKLMARAVVNYWRGLTPGGSA